MTFPPGAYPLRSNFQNSDAQHDDHPGHHNNLADALNEVVQWGEAEYQRMLMQVPLRAIGPVDLSHTYGVGDVVQRAATDDLSLSQRTYVCIQSALGSALDNTDFFRGIDTIHFDNTYVRPGQAVDIAQPLFFISQTHPNQLNGEGFGSEVVLNRTATGGTFDLTVNINNEVGLSSDGTFTVTIPCDTDDNAEIAAIFAASSSLLRYQTSLGGLGFGVSVSAPTITVSFDNFFGYITFAVDDTNATGGTVTIDSTQAGWAAGLDAPLGSLCLVQGVNLVDGDLFLKNGVYPWSWSEWPGGRPFSAGAAYLGNYSFGRHYVPGDCVVYNGTAWVAQRETVAEIPNTGATIGESAWAPLTYGDNPGPMVIHGQYSPDHQSQLMSLQLTGASSGTFTLYVDSPTDIFDVVKTITLSFDDNNTAIASAFNSALGVTPNITGSNLASGITLDLGIYATLTVASRNQTNGTLTAAMSPTPTDGAGCAELTAPSGSIYIQDTSDAGESSLLWVRQGTQWWSPVGTGWIHTGGNTLFPVAQSGTTIGGQSQNYMRSIRLGSDGAGVVDFQVSVQISLVSGSASNPITGSFSEIISDVSARAGFLMDLLIGGGPIFWNGTVGAAPGVGMVLPLTNGDWTLLDMTGTEVTSGLQSNDVIIFNGTLWFSED